MKQDLTKLPHYFLFTIDEKGVEVVNYLQQKKSFHKLFACDRDTKKTSEVAMQIVLDANKIMHSKAPYDHNSIYIQAKNIFEANVKFQNFLSKQTENEKKKTQTATQELQG